MKKFYYLIIVFVCVLFGFYLSSCNSSKISSPLNIQIDENNNLIWDKVADARAYEIKFFSVDNNKEEIAQTRKILYSLDNLEEGDYEISISSISGTSAKNSDFSNPIFFHKYYETGCVYTLINNNTEYAITKVGKAQGTFVIEDYYRNRAVTEISDSAFKGSTKIENVTIGSNVEKIGTNAFYNCPKLTNLVIPESVREIGVAVFQNCKALKSIKIPKSILNLPEYAFAYCRGLESVKLPSTLESIGESCFQDCSSLKEISIPDSTTTIATDAFAACSSLEKITFGSGLETIGDNAFIACSKLTNIVFSEDSNLKSMGISAFSDCTSLKTIKLPLGLEEVNTSCFMGDILLENVSIPSTTKHVGNYAFARTKLYTDQYLNGDLFIYADEWLIGYNASKTEELINITASMFKAGTVGIADEVFSKNTSIQTVTTPTSLKYIGDKVFANCINLWKFTTVENSLKSIGKYAFAYCGLTNVSFGPGLEVIDDYAFVGNTQLDNNAYSPYSWIPETVSRIGAYAFYGTKLWTSPRDGNNIVYAGNWVVGYKEDKLGSVILTFDTTRVAGIADYAFSESSSLATIQGLANCKYIGAGAFYKCNNLSSVSLNGNLTEINDYVFYECKSLVKVTFRRALKSIGKYAFYNCNLLESVDLEATNVSYIGYGAFRNCTNLQEVTFGDKLEVISDLAFYNCASIVNLSIPYSTTTIGKKSFYKCLELRTLDLGSGIAVISESAFYNCEKLTSIVIPDNVVAIGRKAFYKCSSVTSITFGQNLEEIGDYAFYDNKNVSKLNFNNNLKSIGNYAFKGLEKVSVLILPKTITDIGQHAFYSMKNVTIYTDAAEMLSHWHPRFNSSRRPIFFKVEFDEEQNVKSIFVSKDLLLNKNATGGISAPAANFSGWRDENDKVYSMEDIIALEEDIKLYAIYE